MMVAAKGYVYMNLAREQTRIKKKGHMFYNWSLFVVYGENPLSEGRAASLNEAVRPQLTQNCNQFLPCN